MRPLASVLAVVMVLAGVPTGAWAQLARTAAVPVRTVPVTAAPPVLSHSAPGLQSLSLPSLPKAATPTLPQAVSARTAPPVKAAAALPAAAAAAVAAAASPAAVPAKAEPLPRRIERLTTAAAKDLEVLPRASGAEARTGAAVAFDRLLGLEVKGRAADAVELPLPARRAVLSRPLSAPSQAAEEKTPAPAKGDVRSYLMATSAFKMGMEALGLAVPLIALTVFGQAKWAAVMAMGWGLSQIIGSSVGGGLLDRKPPAQVLSRVMALQALSVGTLAALFLAGPLVGVPLASPVVVFALHVTTGILAGIADTARQVIPPSLVGNDGQALKVFNAKVHISYETAGVAGALLTGVLIKAFGLVPALLMHPPAYLLAAWLFGRLKMAPALKAEALPGGGFRAAVGRAWRDLKEGARAVKGSKVVFWAAVALVVPLLLHRVLEALLIPIAAKTLLADPSVAAWIIAASNFGELAGAFLLMRANIDEEHPSKLRSPFWVRTMALGILGLWAFTVAPSLWVILPAVAFKSLSWAASDLSLRSKIQETLPPEVRGRAFGFLTAAAFSLVLLVSLTLGVLFDAVAVGPAFLAVNGVLTLTVLGLLFAAARLAKTYK